MPESSLLGLRSGGAFAGPPAGYEPAFADEFGGYRLALSMWSSREPIEPRVEIGVCEHCARHDPPSR